MERVGRRRVGVFLDKGKDLIRDFLLPLAIERDIEKNPARLE